MATFILTTAAAAAISNPYWAFAATVAAAVVGSQIDQALFGPGPMKGPRLDDLRVSSSTYGQPLPLTYGEQNRVPGNLIWSSDLIETKHEEGGKGKGGEVTYYTYSVTCAFSFGLGPIARVKRIWANGKLIFDPIEDPSYTTPIYFGDTSTAGWKPRKKAVRAVRCYLGTPAQPVDSAYQTLVGAANATAYRGEVVIVFENMQLADYGNSIPSITAEIDAGPADVASIVGDLCERSGISLYDVTGYTDTVPGYAITESVSAAEAIGRLMTGFQGVAVSETGGIGFHPLLKTPKFGIDLDANAGATENTPTSEDVLRVSRVPDADLPAEVEVSFFDPARDYQNNTQRSTRREDGAAEGVARISLPIAMSATQGRRVAESALYQAHQQRRSLERIAFPPGFSALAPGSIIAGDAFGVPTTWRAMKVSRGANGIVEIDMVYDDITQLISAATGTSGTVPTQTSEDAVATLFYPLDVPIVRSADDDAGWYAAVSAVSDGWRGVELFRSADNVTFTALGSEGSRAVAGTCSTVLGSGPEHVWDDGATVTVTLVDTEMTLEGIDDAAVLAGGNLALVGNELIHFGDATLTAPGVYVLSRLLRGRLGTEAQIGAHGAAERFILLSGASGIQRVADDATLIGATRYYKPVSLDQELSEVASVAFANTAIGKRPYAPGGVIGVRNTADDLKITWAPRTRLPATWKNPVAGDPDNYTVEILNGSVVVRIITVTGGRTAYYTAAQQASDFGSVQTSYDIRVAQVSAVYGTGLKTTVTVPQQTGATFTVP